jgi:hypothetical protein
MSQAPAAARRQPEIQAADLLDPLWRLAGDLRNVQALIVAEHSLDLMCGLIRRGCLAATIVRPGDKPEAAIYDLLLLPHASALASADHVISLARRSLRHNGALIAGIRDPKATRALARRLRLNGFAAVHSIQLPNLTLLRAELRRPS